VLIASHDERLIARAGARVLRLDHGTLVSDGVS
jgi:ABC-type ATPase involved in cell division